MTDDLRRIRLSRVQHDVFTDPTQIRVWIAGRQSGKSYAAVTECIAAAVARPNAKVWYIGPTRDQVRELAWQPLKHLIPPEYIWGQPNETRLALTLLNGSEIRLQSAEVPERLRGPALDFVVLDEFAYIHKAAWDAVEPTTITKNARVLFISTPCGYNWAYDFYLRGLNQAAPGWKSWQTTTAQSGRIPLERLAERRANLDPRIFRQEYEASFETLEGRVYSNFLRSAQVAPVEDLGGELLVGMDFNVHPMSYVVAQRAGDECHVLASFELPVSNTEEVAAHIAQRYPGRRVIVCPDPSGRARKTSAPVGQTDFTILQRHGFGLDAPSAAPPVVDRVNNVQAMLLNAEGRRRVTISPNAVTLIRALDGLTYREGTNLPDKSGGLDHTADAFGYLCWARFNVLADRTVESRPFLMR